MLMAALLATGVRYEHLERMLKETPARVLGLEPGWTPAVPSVAREHPALIHDVERTAP
jgi:hypothetical protein